MPKPLISRLAPRSRTTTATAALLALATLGAGCSDPFLQRERGRAISVDQRAQQFEVPHERYAELGYRLDWRGFPGTGASMRVLGLDVREDGTVAVIENSSTVSLLEGDTGRLRWQNRIATDLTRLHGVTHGPNGRVVAISEADFFFLDQSTGELVDRQSLSTLANTMPVLEGPVAIYGTSTGRIATHLMTRGLPLWAFGSRGSFEANPVRIGDAIGAISRAGEIVFVRAGDGDLLGRTRIFGGTEPGVHPVASDNVFYVASLDQSVYAFDTSGGQVWRHRTSTPLRNQPMLLDGVLYVTTEQGLTALDGARGDVLWAASDIVGDVIGVRRGRLIVWDHAARSVTLVDPADGGVETRVHLPGVHMLRLSRAVDGDLYAVSETAVVAKFLPTR
ncbi:MAG: hypothetical protein EA378_07305 [Phycisphaerales bacterium]|nr:MAG: hypothetical protein EA378_07305 [Phycisphaerales bacterium]